MSCKLMKKSVCCLKLARHCNISYNVFRTLQTNQDANKDTVDIVISGGGMVGTTLACALGKEGFLHGKKIVLLESASEKKFDLPAEYSNRTCALSPATVNLLSGLGVWDEILQMRCQPVKRMQVWDSCSDSIITFNNDDLNDNLAYIVENDVILEAVKRSLPKSHNLNIKYNTSAKSYIIPGITPGHDGLDQNSWVTVQLNDGSEIKTKLLIGADGMNSTVRKTCEFHTLRSDYGQSGLVATLKLTGDTENNVAWQRFLPTGPIAMLPLSNTDSCLIWTTTTENAKHLKQLSEDSFIDAVNDAFWHDRDMNSLAISAGGILNGVLNNILPGGASSSRQLPPTVVGIAANSRAAFPLGLLHSSSYAGHRVALIGDAAHRIHPLAGQGVNLGFGDVACLRNLLVEAVKNGTDLGSLALLAEYESQRQRSVLPVVGVIDGLQRLYSNSFTPIVMMRSLGLQTVNSLHFLKNIIIKQAST